MNKENCRAVRKQNKVKEKIFQVICWLINSLKNGQIQIAVEKWRLGCWSCHETMFSEVFTNIWLEN